MGLCTTERYFLSLRIAVELIAYGLPVLRGMSRVCAAGYYSSGLRQRGRC
jgi:hypothetical protein